MKKKISYILLCVILVFQISGCNQSSALLLSYEENRMIENSGEENISVSKAELFSKNLCVIPFNKDKDKDGNLTATSSLILDITDKKVIFAHNIYEKVYPASITKILTALIALKYGNLEDIVTVSHNAANITEPGATKCGIKEGDKIQMETLLNAFLVKSGNDAGIAIAEHISGSVEEFAKLMNTEAKSMGAVNSNFVNPHGLHDDKHYTTAYDMYLILNTAVTYKKFVNMIHLDKYEAIYKDKNGKKVSMKYDSTNRYLNGNEPMPEGITVIGGKTGTTSKAGSCLSLYSKDKKEHEYLSFLFKTESSNSLYFQMSYLLKLIQR